ncbi:HNH endonuclease signature motif containing protein [Enterobacter kobei]|uniref:HNH endonuclease signature motif containing protein n=1 Tax=Enterobacter kobei TaxID=208224 RepID=UPI0038619759
MVEYFFFNGNRYRRYPEAKTRTERVYFQRRTPDGVRRLHRDVWEHHYGEIPEGFHVHHKDGDPLNNAVENLELLSEIDHREHHKGDAWHKTRKSDFKEHLDRIRPLTKEWHASEEGRRKHSEIGAQAYKNFNPDEKLCANCGNRFVPKKIGSQDKFCSNNCKSEARRKSGVDDETRSCVCCEKEFVVNKYSRNKTCSRACAMRLRWANK